MVSTYSSLPLAAAVWWPLRRRLRPLPLWGFVLFALPLVIDGVSHLISDLAGVDQGFRAANAWLADLTGSRLPAAFYAGNALGSFNSWMRLVTGALFGIGAVWFAFPHVDLSFRATATAIREKFERAGMELGARRRRPGLGRPAPPAVSEIASDARPTAPLPSAEARGLT